jgi:A/G-specific adenine glycosylase
MRALSMNSRQLTQLRRALLGWYDLNRRDLPWRETRDAYRIWVSEIMLQQTRVAAVLPRYENFLRRFPSVEKLASARVASVLTEWSGLGYYRRARNLHAAAKVIVRERKGNFPEYAEQWRELPGIGRYTAAAIASIAFAQSVAVLDGNVDRVLRRLMHSASSRESWNAAQQILDHERPGDFNQAMMELGATVCVPGEPLCHECPIRRFCRTRGRGETRIKKPRQLKVSISVAFARKGESILLVRRSATERLMPGMWELPATQPSARGGKVLFTARHSITVTDYLVKVIAQPGIRTEGKWIRTGQLDKLPLTGLTKKILRKAQVIEWTGKNVAT